MSCWIPSTACPFWISWGPATKTLFSGPRKPETSEINISRTVYTWHWGKPAARFVKSWICYRQWTFDITGVVVKGEVGEEAHHWLFEIWLSGSAAERRRGWGGGSHYKSDWHSYHLVAPNAARPPMIPTASSWVTSAHEQKINRFYPDTRHYQIADVKSKHSMSCENPDQIFIVPP